MSGPKSLSNPRRTKSSTFIILADSIPQCDATTVANTVRL
jgi:hypothetical protein